MRWPVDETGTNSVIPSITPRDDRDPHDAHTTPSRHGMPPLTTARHGLRASPRNAAAHLGNQRLIPQAGTRAATRAPTVVPTLLGPGTSLAPAGRAGSPERTERRRNISGRECGMMKTTEWKYRTALLAAAVVTLAWAVQVRAEGGLTLEERVQRWNDRRRCRRRRRPRRRGSRSVSTRSRPRSRSRPSGSPSAACS